MILSTIGAGTFKKAVGRAQQDHLQSGRLEHPLAKERCIHVCEYLFHLIKRVTDRHISIQLEIEYY